MGYVFPEIRFDPSGKTGIGWHNWREADRMIGVPEIHVV